MIKNPILTQQNKHLPSIDCVFVLKLSKNQTGEEFWPFVSRLGKNPTAPSVESPPCEPLVGIEKGSPVWTKNRR